MKINIRLIVLVELGILIGGVNSNIPIYFPVCLRHDPNISNCVAQSIKILQPRFPSGDLGSGFRIPKTEPFYIQKLAYGSPERLRMILKDVYIRGMSNFELSSVSVNIDDLRFEFVLTFPQLEMVANYRLTLGAFGAPLTSEGRMYGSYYPVKVHVILKARKYLRNGIEYIYFDPIYFRFLQHAVKDVKLTNLFNENSLLSRIVYSYILQNKDYLSAYINPDLEKTFSAIFTNVANLIAGNASFDELFPR